jgi:hypothetical protein
MRIKSKKIHNSVPIPVAIFIQPVTVKSPEKYTPAGAIQ